MGALSKTSSSIEIRLRRSHETGVDDPELLTFALRPSDQRYSSTCCNRGDTSKTFIFIFTFTFATTLKGPSLLTWHGDVATSNTTEPSLSFLETCKRWLDDCKEHESCRSLFPVARFATRLLDLQGHFPDLRLCCTDGLDKEAVYMTLGHCWGAPNDLEPIKLTREIYQTYLQVIHLDTLPITFRDTITPVRVSDADICGLMLYAYILIDTERNTAES
ncbi:hypothetical protein B0J14DRAFT_211730 [Halenospora varia]|nr:hypothetical protein B0J14DRAFT_211730 [Halenospora varia]